MKTRAVLSSIVFFLSADMVISLTQNARNFVMFPGNHTWNEVQDICVTSGFDMVKIASGSEMEALMVYVKKWKTAGKLTNDIWSGLFDAKALDKDVTVYKWQKNCSILGDYKPWSKFGKEPNNRDVDMCVRVSLSMTFKTKTCNETFHAVCEENIGACWFEKLAKRKLKSSDESISSTDLNSCLEICKTKDYSGSNECVALDYDAGGSKCRIVLGSSVYVENDVPSTGTSSKIDVHIKRCYKGSYTSTLISVPENKDAIPIDKCTTTSTTASTNTVTTTSMTTTPATTTPISTTLTTTTTTTTTITTTAATTTTTTPTTTTISTTTTLATTTSLTTTTITTPTTATSSTTSMSTTSLTTISTIATSTTTSTPTCSSTVHGKVCICGLTNTRNSETFEEVLKTLVVDKKLMSSYIRSKTSASDNRPTAVGIGTSGVSLLAVVVVSLIIADTNRLVVSLKQICKVFKKPPKGYNTSEW